MYPNFEPKGKHTNLGSEGWGAKDLHSKTTIRQFGPAYRDYNRSIDRMTLKYLD